VNDNAISPTERHAVNAALRRWYELNGESAPDLVALLTDMNALAARVVRELRNEHRERDQFGWDTDPNLRS